MDPLLLAQLHMIAATADATHREALHGALAFQADLVRRLDELQRLVQAAQRRAGGGTRMGELI